MFVRDCCVFLRGERKNTASPCRNIFHAMRLEGCKEFLLVAMRYEWPNGTLITQIRQDERRLYFVLSLIPQRIAGIFAEKSKGFSFAKNITHCETMK